MVRWFRLLPFRVGLGLRPLTMDRLNFTLLSVLVITLCMLKPSRQPLSRWLTKNLTEKQHMCPPFLVAMWVLSPAVMACVPLVMSPVRVPKWLRLSVVLISPLSTSTMVL